MKEKIKNFFIAFALIIPTTAIAQSTSANNVVQIILGYQKVDSTKDNTGHPRTPVQVPYVYLNQDANSLLFETPCYECTLELVVPGTDTTAFSYVIPDGDDVVQLPTYLSGTYELHIHRGIFCFYATIEL